MHRLALLLLVFLSTVLPLSVGTVWAGGNIFDHKLPFKTAVIAYVVSGSSKGTETLSVADYGRRRAHLRDTATKILFITTKTHTLEITDPDWQTTIDLDKKSGTKTINMNKLLKEEYGRLSAAEQKVVRANMKKMGASALGGEQQIQYKAVKLLGHTCDLVTVAGMSATVLSGTDITVKSDMETMGIKSHILATRIDTGVSVPGNRFAVPKGVTVSHDTAQDEQNRQAARTTIAYLKDPHAAEKSRANYEEAQQAMEESGYSAGNQPADEGSSGAEGDAVKEGINALKGLFK